MNHTVSHSLEPPQKGSFRFGPPPSNKPPRLRLRGGDVPRGGNPGATGHAGRWHLGFAVAFVVFVFMGTLLCGQNPSVAYARTTVRFPNGGTATLNDDGTLTGKAEVGHWLDDLATLYPVTLPDGTSTTGHCIDYMHYAPQAGSYSFTATPSDNGAYSVVVHSDSSPYVDDGSMLAPPQRLGDFKWAPVLEGKLKLVKVSALPTITNDNDCYTLEGARYGVWKNKECTEGTGASYDLITSSNGTSNEVNLSPGTYWVKENKAPKGYAVDTTVYKVNIEAGSTTTVNAGSVKDTPLYEKPDVWVRKQDAHYGSAQGSASLDGAEFTIRYYDGTYDEHDLPTTPTRTWVVKSDASGNIFPNDSSLVRGGALYRNEDSQVVLPLGTLAIQETKAPKGYWLEGQDENSPADYTAPVHLAHVDGTGSFQTLVVQEQVKRAGISLQKVDSQTGATPQGDASLANVTFSLINRNDQAVVVNDVVSEPGEYVNQTLETDENGYAQTPANCLPLGTYEVVESATNASMLNTSTAQTVTLTVAHTNTIVPISAPMSNEVARGSIVVGKVSRETRQHLTQGEATLAGAEFSLTNNSEHAIVFKGSSFAPGAVITTITTDEDGIARTDDRALPYGTYTVREEKAPVGFLLNSDWSQTVYIRNDGEVCDVSTNEKSVDDQVMRGGFSFNKVDETTMERMGKTAWRITSCTTSESHVIVADENGIVDTEAADHTNKTNANDACVSEKGVDEEALDAEAGIWFSGRGDLSTDPNNELSALPYDVYTVEELPSKENEGHELVKFTVRIHRHDVHLNMGTVDNIRTQEPSIQTTLTNGANDHIAPVSSEVTLVDTVHYEGLTPGMEYVLRGELHEPGCEDAFVDANGEEVVSYSKPFTPDVSAGTANVVFSFNASDCEGKALVAYEYLLLGEDEVTSHKNDDDKDQTIWFPHIGTTLTDKTGSHEVTVTEQVELVDTVAYENLVPYVRYELQGTLMDAETEEPLYDGSQQPVTASTSFIPESSDGTVEVTFQFDGACAEGKTLVAFETLMRGNTIVAQHEDLQDAQQTVHMPAIQTELTTTQNQHVVPHVGMTKLVDTIAFQGLEQGAAYTLEGVLMNKQTGKPVVDADGKEVRTSANFTADEAAGTTTVEFDVDTSLIAGTETVAFETLNRDDREVYVHADLNNASQTVYTPKITTTFASAEGTHEAAAGTVTLTDTVAYEGLNAGNPYTLVAHIIDKETGEVLVGKDGATIISQVTFTPEEAQGSVEVPFTIDTSKLAGHALVAFEYLHEGETQDGTEVARHADVKSADQTIVIPRLATTARNANDNTQELAEHGTAHIRDTVAYEGLTPGETYVMTGTLHSKDTGKDLGSLLGTSATVTKEFVPERANGTVEMDFSVSMEGISGSGIVVFETCTHNGVDVATHADINDRNQTLLITRGTAAKEHQKDHTPSTGDTTPLYLVGALALVGASLVVTNLLLKKFPL